MSTLDPGIRDQAYQFFRQESLDFLQTIEDGLIALQGDRSIGNIHQMMRAAHSIKGGAASVDLPGIARVAHNLEDVFRGLYRYEADLDPDFEELLFQGFDILRTATLDQVQTGSYDLQAIADSEPIFEVLTSFLGVGSGDEAELPTSAELGIDIVKVVFEGDVSQGIARLEAVLANADHEEVRGEFHAQAEVFGGLAELFNLPGFKAISTKSMQALDRQPTTDVLALGAVIIQNFQAAQAAVLAGDRSQGGSPNPDLLRLAGGIVEPQVEESNLTEVAELSLGQGLAMLENLFGEDLAPDLEDFNQFSSAPSFDSGLDELENLFGDPESALALDADESLENMFGTAIDDDGEFDLFSTNNLEDLEIPENPAESFLDLAFLGEDIASAMPELAIEDEVDLFAPSAALFQQSESLDDFFGGDSDPEPAPIVALKPEPKALATISQTNQFFKLTPEKQKESVQGKEALAAPYLLETVRVDLKRLDRLSNLTGELVTQENGSLLQIQQLEEKIGQLQKRFGNFEKITKSLEKWMDQSQKAEVRTLSLSRKFASESANGRELDPLLMDSYSGLHTLVQEGLEEVLQMNESMRDMTMLTQQVQSIQRKKQQTLKQVRSDLLWSRMIPLNDILNRFPRMVRELSLKYKKPVALKQVGAATLIDKATLEKLYDPLVHLIRNAFDHGTDTPQERQELDKSPQATIEIRAYHRGNQTFIEVRDDGRGIDPEKVKAKAIANGLITAQEAIGIAKERIYSFLFAPNFSTAATVSELSGRGVGLSTVQEQVTSLKGTINIASEVGLGTTFTIRLPLTLTIAKLLVFNIDANFFAIPVDTLISIVNVTEDQLQTLQGQVFYRFQDRLIPVLPTSKLSEHYPLPKRTLRRISEMLLPDEEGSTILLVSNGTEVVGMPADYIIAEQELVIKPFSKIIASPSYLYGCTILADGSLVPVIDGSALIAKWLNRDITFNYSGSASSSPAPKESSTINTPSVQPTILVIDDSLTARQTLLLTLQKAGYQVVSASDGKEALEQLDKVKNIDAVFCDVEMPVMNGFEFLTACRKQPIYGSIPVAMLTSRSGQKHREIAKLLGANAYLTKPYLEQDLLNTLQILLQPAAKN